ncbi:MAG: nitroreductase family protein [Halioglobus sp.]|nr:nitroreductase family protein [Halioglobus sp.]
MSNVLEFLQQRNSSPKLTTPGPSDDDMEHIFRAALRAPDHAQLRPSRFITITQDRRAAFGILLEQCLLSRNPDADEATLSRARNSPLRAPLLVVVVVKITLHPKVPPIEQRFSGACAAQAVLLAAEASGFAGIWRTGAAAFDRAVMTGLGLAEDEEIIGFLYIGSRNGAAKVISPLDITQFVSTW